MSELLFLCIKVFFIRIIDVSMGTLRTIITVKGNRVVATIIAFFEALIWFLVVKEALTTDMKSIWIGLSYAGGFSVGTFVGSFLSSKFIKGTIGFQVILSNRNDETVDKLRNKGYAVSVVDVMGQNNEKKYMLFIEINHRRRNELTNIIKNLDNKAFIVVNESKFVMNGYFGK